jgi:SM-20-related protein
MTNCFDILIDSFLDNKIGIDTGFLSESLSSGLQKNIRELQEQDLMTSAGIGNNKQKDPSQKVRSDKIYWMDKSHSNRYETEFLQMIEDFITYLNSTCYTGINSYEFHYTLYV